MNLKILMAILSFFLVASCRSVTKNVKYMGGNTPTGKTPQSAGITYNYIPKQGDIGKEKTCPVNGQIVVVKENTPAVTFKGQVFYFCCISCMQEFKKNPEKFNQ